MLRTIVNIDTNVMLRELVEECGEITPLSLDFVKTQLCELDTIKVDQDWYVIVGKIEDRGYVVEPIYELNVLDDYLTERQCEELSQEEM